MIFDVLNQQIKLMKELQRRQRIKENKQQQDLIDRKYIELATKVQKTFDLVIYLSQELGFEISDKARKDLGTLLSNLKEAVQSGYADSSNVASSENFYNSVQTTLRKEWKEQYNAISATKLSTLHVISGISPQEAAECVDDIKAAETWGAEVNVYIDLKKALDRASVLINDLDMDQEIIAFLQKMNNNRATIVDLSSKVLSWIQRENLQTRIKLSFSTYR